MVLTGLCFSKMGDLRFRAPVAFSAFHTNQIIIGPWLGAAISRCFRPLAAWRQPILTHESRTLVGQPSWLTAALAGSQSLVLVLWRFDRPQAALKRCFMQMFQYGITAAALFTWSAFSSQRPDCVVSMTSRIDAAGHRVYAVYERRHLSFVRSVFQCLKGLVSLAVFDL